MANIRIKDLPVEGAPKADDRVPIDLGTTRQATVESFVFAGRPTASKTEAEAGTDPKKAMTPLTVKQAIDAQVGPKFVPQTRKVIAGAGLTGGGALTGDVTVGLTVENVDRLTKVDGIEAGAQVNSVTSVSGRTGAVILNKSDVGLSNVENTSDAAKPISTATQAALDSKANSAITITAGAGLTGGGDLSSNRTVNVGAGAGISVAAEAVALNAASIASLAKADSAIQAPGGSTGQILAKNSATTNDVGWVSSEAATAVSYAPQTLTAAQQVQARQNIQADKSYDSIASVAAATVPGFANAIRTNGYYSAGDGGGALYKRVATEPTRAGKMQSADGAWWELSADGAWWELSEDVVNLKALGAKPDSTGVGVGTNNSPIFTAAILCAVALRKNVYVPAGVYRLATTVIYDKSSLNADNQAVPSIIGDGVTMTRFNCDASGLRIVGSLAAGFYVSWIEIKDLQFMGDDRLANSIGIDVENQGFLRLERIKCSEFEIGARLKGVISSKVEQPYLSYNRVGLHALPDDEDLWAPNALTIDQPWIASNTRAGIVLDKPATFNIRGGSVEGNGTDTSISVNQRGGILVTSSGLGGHAAIVSDGVYYEYNSGIADVLFFGTSREAASAFSGNTFTRMGPNPTNCCIGVFGITHKFSLSINGNGFGELGSGVISTDPYITIENNPLVRISESGNTYQNLTYAPNFSGVMADCEQTRPIAMGYITGAGTVEGSSVNIASVVKVAAGQYKINLASAVPGRKFAMTQPGSALVTYNLTFDATSVTVGFTNLDGAGTDTEFGVLVYATGRR